MVSLMKITEILTTDEIRDLKTLSDRRGAMAVASTWCLIAGAFALVAWHPAIWTIVPALVILGGRHLALAILMHDASHYSLFKTRWLNDLVGSWLCAYPTWQHLTRYREHHMAHHKWAGSEKDPDADLVAAFPTSPASLKRKFARDVAGISGVKRIYGLLLMDFGFIKYTVSSNVVHLPQKGRTLRSIVAMGTRNLTGMLVTNALLLSVATLVGKPWLYLLWLGSYLTLFSVFIRIRSIAEHACTAQGLDPFSNTRTTEANILCRLTVAPHRVNYHLEHHLLMTVPYFNLPRLHRLLEAKGVLKNAFRARGYGEVLLTASSNRKSG